MITRASCFFCAALVALTVTVTAGCGKDTAKSNASIELQNVPATKAGVADDGVRTVAPTGTVIPKGGLRDPSVLPVNPRGGVRDPSVKPISPKSGTTAESIGTLDPAAPKPTP